MTAVTRARARLARTYYPHKSSALRMQTRSYLGCFQLEFGDVALRPRRRPTALVVPAVVLVQQYTANKILLE